MLTNRRLSAAEAAQWGAGGSAKVIGTGGNGGAGGVPSPPFGVPSGGTGGPGGAKGVVFGAVGLPGPNG
ncbi:hypothetical protein AO501_10425 [Mycobacterium gordonae]|uniref:Uncharacterized protein n=1 Tax=Mycobacterium gordonae TaxID=1778 RepID=A0A0Q2MKR4_MYCGO|nr:hypothetical protein AO501_10425 [Mycobacterium gordonae]